MVSLLGEWSGLAYDVSVAAHLENSLLDTEYRKGEMAAWEIEVVDGAVLVDVAN